MVSQPNINYESADLAQDAMEQVGIQDLPFESASLDYFICFEGLENVTDLQAALSEVRRILKPGGTAFFHVRIDWRRACTREEKTPDSDRAAGDSRPRRYGRDFPTRIEAAGFKVEPFFSTEQFPPELCSRFALSAEPIFVARKVAA